MILVTGAGGKTGMAVTRALIERGIVVRALVRDQSQTGRLRELDAHEVVVGNMRGQQTWDRVVRSAVGVYHICPNVAPDEIEIGHLALRAAREAGIRQFVYHSVLHPQIESMPHHWQKLRVEEAIFQSGLPFTIVQPATYMQNVLPGWDSIREQGVLRVPYALSTRLGMVDLEDVAAAAAGILTNAGHIGATYELGGPEVHTPEDTARMLSLALDRPVRAEILPLEVWERETRDAGLHDYGVSALKQMFRYYERFGFWGNPRVLESLLGRPPATFAAFAARVAREG